MNTAEKKRLKEEYLKKESESFIASLPMPKALFQELFNYLDEMLEEHSCRHDLTLTKAFLLQHNISEPAVIDWLMEHGGGCDCEVLFNVEESFEDE